MDSYELYKDIQCRTNGEIYIGVVGPVRTGKSTFIKRFMNLLVIPEILDENKKNRALDELPQSASGTTIMTTEPKFVPNEAANIMISKDCNIKIRLIDCVGYMVNGAAGHMENDMERMVKTPWFDKEIPFSKAAEIGTNKVITKHSTIGLVITTDGSFGTIPKENYSEATDKTIRELKNLGKPFIVIVNCVNPQSPGTKSYVKELKEQYETPVLAINCDQLNNNDIINILESCLYEFPLSSISFFMPPWVELLPEEHWLKGSLIETALKFIAEYPTIKAFKNSVIKWENTYIKEMTLDKIHLSNGNVDINIKLAPDIYYKVISELTNTPINNEYELINTIKDLSQKKNSLKALSDAANEVDMKGYGIVMPLKDNIDFREPEIIKNGNKYGVRIKALAPSINLLKTNINVEIAPIVGSEEQAKDLIQYINQNMSDNPTGIWDTNIFGKTIGEIIENGIKEKTMNITDESMAKITETIEKVMNDNNGLVCLIV